MLTVIYRACSVGNPFKARPIPRKVDLVKFCFNSFKTAFENVEHELICLLDKPDNELRRIFIDEKTEETFYSDFGTGNIESFHRQIDIASEKKGKFFFVEDDYLFLPGSGKIIEDALNYFDFITPYDHPGYYFEKEHEYERRVRLIGNQHWQSVKSTTLTFGGDTDCLREEKDTMLSYGWRDHPMWCDITKRKKLWAPIPSLATHCEMPHLAPSINWKDKFENPN